MKVNTHPVITCKMILKIPMKKIVSGFRSWKGELCSISDFCAEQHPALGPVPQEIMQFHFSTSMVRLPMCRPLCCCSRPAWYATSPTRHLPVPKQDLGCPLFSEMVHSSTLHKQSMPSWLYMQHSPSHDLEMSFIFFYKKKHSCCATIFTFRLLLWTCTLENSFIHY